MAEGILGLGSSGAGGLSQELIDKLKAAESRAQVEPYTTKLETWDKELEKITEIETKVTELLSKISNYDLYSSGAHSFEQVTASTTGTSASFNAVDVSGLTEGSNSINITQLAQRDVYQTAIFADKEVQVDGGDTSGDKITIQIGSGAAVDFTTVDKTYEELAADINNVIGLTASIEQVGDSSYRLVIKSTDSGTANALTITQTGVNIGIDAQQKSNKVSDVFEFISGGQDTGDKITINGIDFNTKNETYDSLASDINAHGDFNASISNGQIIISRVDGADVNITEIGVDMGFTSAILSAQNMKAQVDGIDYDVSSNTITIQGNLTMTAVETGISTISIQKDNSQILPGLQEFVTSYNELVTLVDDELYSADSSINDTSTLKMIMSSIKDKIFSNYGPSSDINVFNYGFGVDKTGYLSIDTETFANAMASNPDDLKALFVGDAVNEGLGTQLKEYLDELDGYEGLLTKYGESMADRKTDLEDEKEKAQELLDSKYSLMAQQFAAYTAVITQMETAFGGMKMMMDQSTAS